MRKKYLKLTKDQKERGIIFSSQLKQPMRSGVTGNAKIKEVSYKDPEAQRKIRLLKDDKFFDGLYAVNEIRQ